METIPMLFCAVTDRYRGTPHVAYMDKKEGKFIEITYDMLRTHVEDYAFALEKIGIETGDRIAIISENRYEWVLTDFATLLVGGVDVPLFPTLTAKQIAYILNHSQAVLCAVSTYHQLNKLASVAEELETLEGIILFDAERGQTAQKSIVGRIPVYSIGELIEEGKSVSDSRAARISSFLQRTQPDDLCTIIYTSGTTGTPKGVMLTHRNILSNVEAARAVIEVREDDVFLSYLPLCHSYERTAGYYTAFASGATTAFAESLETVRTNLQEVRPTVMTSVPQFFERVRKGIYARIAQESKYRQRIFDWAVAVGMQRIMENEERGRSSIATALRYRLADRLVLQKLRNAAGGRLRLFVSGGGPLAADVNRFFWAIGLPILEGYGLTEASPVLTVNRLDDNEFGTVGKPLPGVEIRIDDSGEILARGPNIMRGYWRDPLATAEVLDQEGWLHTGDIGEWTAKGNLKITDRVKNIIVTSGGKNVAPQTVEAVLQRLPFVAQVILVGDNRPFCAALIVPDEDNLRALARQHKIDDQRSIEELCQDTALIAALMPDIEHAQRDLAKYERARRIALIPEPFTVENGLLTPTLKLRRKQIHERYAAIIERLYAETQRAK